MADINDLHGPQDLPLGEHRDGSALFDLNEQEEDAGMDLTDNGTASIDAGKIRNVDIDLIGHANSKKPEELAVIIKNYEQRIDRLSRLREKKLKTVDKYEKRSEEIDKIVRAYRKEKAEIETAVDALIIEESSLDNEIREFKKKETCA